jgi:hypothetical protein
VDGDNDGRVTYHLECINPAHVEMVWPYVEPLIKAAVEKPRLSDFAVVRHDLFSGGALLWIAWNGYEVKAAAVTQCAIANGDKTCTIVACGGQDAKEWLPLIHGLEVYAKQEGCRATRIMGRAGWKRMLPDYHEIGLILERTL